MTAIDLDGPRVLVKFKIDEDIGLGERTEAAIKTKSLLGAKILEVTPRGDGHLAGPIPVERTTLALSAARRAGRSGHHDQRPEHRPAVRLAGHPGRDLRRTPRRI